MAERSGEFRKAAVDCLSLARLTTDPVRRAVLLVAPWAAAPPAQSPSPFPGSPRAHSQAPRKRGFFLFKGGGRIIYRGRLDAFAFAELVCQLSAGRLDVWHG